MVGHQAVRPHLYAMLGTSFSHQATIHAVIFLSEKHRLPVIPSSRDVVRKPGCATIRVTLTMPHVPPVRHWSQEIGMVPPDLYSHSGRCQVESGARYA